MRSLCLRGCGHEITGQPRADDAVSARLTQSVGLRESTVHSMLIFRCTRRVVKRFKLQIIDDAPASTGILGDWYANLMNVGRTRWVLCQSERSLLPVILPAKNDAFPGQFGVALGAVLRALGVREDLIERELASASDLAFSRPRSRQMLGVMNDFAFNSEVRLPASPGHDPVLEACLKLAEMPSRPIGFESPGRLTLALFRAGRVS